MIILVEIDVFIRKRLTVIFLYTVLFDVYFPPMDEDDKFANLPYFWISEDILELQVRRDYVPNVKM